jgi:hypothetical protein
MQTSFLGGLKHKVTPQNHVTNASEGINAHMQLDTLPGLLAKPSTPFSGLPLLPVIGPPLGVSPLLPLFPGFTAPLNPFSDRKAPNRKETPDRRSSKTLFLDPEAACSSPGYQPKKLKILLMRDPTFGELNPEGLFFSRMIPLIPLIFTGELAPGARWLLDVPVSAGW